MVTEKNNFVQMHKNALHNFAKSKLISKCENDRP